MKHSKATSKAEPGSGIDGIARNDFVDEAEGDVKVRSFTSGRGRVSGGSVSGGSVSEGSVSEGSVSEGNASKGKSKGNFSKGNRARQLEPETICDAGGRLGWRVKLPGALPLATPAVANGRVLLGGGFGSHEFYAFETETGKLLWKLRTKDDGPTAGTVMDDYVAFNTESCTLYVVDARSGRVAWERWLGDPLMAQPAISGTTLFMAYPDNRGKHWLTAFDLQKGESRWKTELIADVISSPVVDGGSVYAATLDGTVYRIDAGSGKSLWSINQRATSAPWLHRGKIYISLREEVEGSSQAFTAEAFQTAIIDKGFNSQIKSFSRRKAEYLKMGHVSDSFFSMQDAKVGFGSAPGSAKIHMARQHLGLGHVASVWSFQGSRPEVFDDGCFGVLDDVVQKVELGTKKPLWRSRLIVDEKEGHWRLGRNLSPPAVSSTRLYLTSVLGDLFALDRETGEEIWALSVGSPILSQPSLAEGKVFLGTADGFLYAFQSDDPDPVGWPMWGGGPGHNGPGASAGAAIGAV